MFGGTKRMWVTLSIWNLIKLLKHIVNDHNWLFLWQNGKIDITTWFCRTARHHHTRHENGSYYLFATVKNALKDTYFKTIKKVTNLLNRSFPSREIEGDLPLKSPAMKICPTQKMLTMNSISEQGFITVEKNGSLRVPAFKYLFILCIINPFFIYIYLE